MASGRSRRVASTPSPSRVIVISRARTSPAEPDHEQPRRVRAAVDCGERTGVRHADEYHRARRGQASGRVRPKPSRHPRPDHVVPAGQPPGQVGVEALDPLARAAHSPARARPGPVGAVSRRRARPRSGDGRRPGPRRPPAPPPPARRRPPRAAPRATRSSGSTSQYRVGMGVPSRRKGSLAMTTGRPSSPRTTTVKAPPGSRPSSSATASARSSSRLRHRRRPPRASTPEFEGVQHRATRSQPDDVGVVSGCALSRARATRRVSSWSWW